MDLNSSPLPEDDENYNEGYAKDVQLPSEAVQTMFREREERRRRLKRENQGEGPKQLSQPSQIECIQNKTPRHNGRVRQLPQGWLDCPSHGQPIGCMVPSKVPLDDSYNDLVQPGKRYSSRQVINSLRRNQGELGLVIDLTNTTRYYSPSEWTKLGVKHVKIRCRGRDAVPDNESVNTFVYEVMQFLTRHKLSKKYILVHCTHGHNRTGFMIVNFIMRSQPMRVTEAICMFAQNRPPGIYKQDYIQALCAFYHEIPHNLICPSTPEWKKSSEFDLNGDAVPDEDDDGNTEALLHEHVENKLITNDDVLGDPIPFDQQDSMRLICYQLFDLTPSGRGNAQFPGSHPVSVNRDNLELLRQRYYYATWKADGTRYMMLITTYGCYLIDRNFSFRRVQMRFPMKNINEGFHHFTLLDGEMVIDKVPNSGLKRRYLIYDLVAFNSCSVVKGWDDPYVPRTHEGLLKWKYPEMNSVDFLFEVGSDDRELLFLFERGKKKLMDGARVIFRGDEETSSLSGKVIECYWDADVGSWMFMRIRSDKITPNDINTYRKVMRSIDDNITEEVLLNEIAETIRLPMYAARIAADEQRLRTRR